MRVKPMRSHDDVGPEQQAEVDRVIEVLGRVEGPFQVLMHSPGTAMRAVELGAHLRTSSSLTQRDRQLVIAGVASELRCEFMWKAHRPRTIEAGVPEDQLDAIWAGESDLALPIGDADIVEYVRSLHRGNRVEDELFERMRAGHDERWMVDITATMGQYLLIGTVLNAFEVT
jgi:4-carboxymuconolactone decarboxylase